MSVCDEFPAIGRVVDELGIGTDLVDYESTVKIAKHVGFPKYIQPADVISNTLFELESWIRQNYEDKP